MTQSIPDCFDTQGIEEEEVALDSRTPAWGRFLSLNPLHASLDMVEERAYTAGRLESNDLVVSCPIVSGTHFKVWRDEQMSSVILRDTSTNGTFVNGTKLGKGKQLLLCNGATVCLARVNANLKPEPITEEITFMYVDCMEERKEEEAGGPQAKYYLKETLGSGAFATVRKAVDKVTFEMFAIKIIAKKKFSQSPEGRKHSLMDEVEILQRLDHPNIIGIKEVFDTETNLYLVLELVTGGELFDYILEKQLLTEEETRPLFVQMLDTMSYLHNEGVAHRDLKLENILMKDKARDVIKISDFGLSRIIGEGSFMKTICGTPEYLAPEVLTNAKAEGYSKAVDMWSLGVVLYTMICGYRPFESAADSTVLERVVKGKFSFPDAKDIPMSEELKDLISRLLTVSPKERITADEALKHPWVVKNDRKRRREAEEQEEDEQEQEEREEEHEEEAAVRQMVRDELEDDSSSEDELPKQVKKKRRI